jgi:hypothetical protein
MPTSTDPSESYHRADTAERAAPSLLSSHVESVGRLLLTEIHAANRSRSGTPQSVLYEARRAPCCMLHAACCMLCVAGTPQSDKAFITKHVSAAKVFRHSTKSRAVVKSSPAHSPQPRTAPRIMYDVREVVRARARARMARSRARTHARGCAGFAEPHGLDTGASVGVAVGASVGDTA